MRGLAWLLALFAAAVAASIALEDGGYVVVVVPPWRLELSLVLALLLFVGLFVAGHFTLRLVAHAMALPTHVRAFRARRAQRSGLRALAAAEQAFFEGRYGQAERYAEQAWTSNTDRGFTSLVGARAAHRRRDYARRDDWLRRSETTGPEWRRARLTLQAEQYLDERRYEEAKALLDELNAGGARHIATLQLLLRAEQGLSHWSETVRLARILEKRGALPVEAVDSIVVRARTAELARISHDAGSLGDFWRTLPERERTHPRIAAAAARAFIERQDCRSAHRLIEQALKAGWESELVLLYAQCRDEDALARIEKAEAWLTARPRDAALLLTLGRLCAQRELWGKAQSYLEASLSAEPSAAAHIALAKLFEALGRPEDAARHYRESAGGEAALATA